jgi:hypothetical protein
LLVLQVFEGIQIDTGTQALERLAAWVAVGIHWFGELKRSVLYSGLRLLHKGTGYF